MTTKPPVPGVPSTPAALAPVRVYAKDLIPSSACHALIQRFETLRLAAYDDDPPNGTWTIGWGHTRGVKPGDQITEETARAFFTTDCAEAAKTVQLAVGTLPLYQHEFDALVSAAFNLGPQLFWVAGGFARTQTNTLATLRAGDYTGFANRLLRWNRAGGRALPGLDRRRCAERALFGGDPDWKKWLDMKFYLAQQALGKTGIKGNTHELARLRREAGMNVQA